MENNGVCLFSVASGTSCFLKIGFGRVGQIEMDYQTYIGFVNAHSEGIGCYHHTAFAALPAFLADIFDGIVQSGMIEVGGDTFVDKQFGDFFGTATATNVDDSASLHPLKNM